MSEAERLAGAIQACFKDDFIDAAAAELRRLSAELAEVRKQMDAQKDEWLSWDVKRKALEKDAERYRWLRKQHWSENLIGVVVRPKDQTMLGSLLPCGSLLDDTVDHMKSTQEATQKGQQ